MLNIIFTEHPLPKSLKFENQKLSEHQQDATRGQF